MARLPVPGSDSGQWGQILNDFLNQAHGTDGSLKDGNITKVKLASDVQASLSAADNAIPSSQKGAANGIATLTGTTLTMSQIPAAYVSKSANAGDAGKAIDAYTGAPLAVGSGIIGLTEINTSTEVAGVTVILISAVAFIATGSPVRVKLVGGTFSAAAAVVITWDLYDPITAQILRQSVRSYATANSFEPIPMLERVFTPTAGDYVVQFRVKTATNVVVNMQNGLTSPDQSPLQLIVEQVGIS